MQCLIASFLVCFLVLFSSCSSNSVTNSVTNSSSDAVPQVQSSETYSVTIHEDIVYAQGLRHQSINSDNPVSIPLKLDIYTPNTTNTQRPVFVYIHGGGFYGGSKQQVPLPNFAHYFASRGWVFVSIDYRLQSDYGTVPQEWVTFSENLPNAIAEQFLAIYPAQRDAKAALRWLVANANTYHINTNYITVGGGSAGAITALAVGVSEASDYTHELSITDDSTLASTHLSTTFQVKTSIDFWGSKVALDALEQLYGDNRFNSSNPPLLILHGTEDTTVPFSEAEALQSIYESNSVPLAFYPVEGAGHGVWNAVINNKTVSELTFDFITQQQQLDIQ